MQQNEMSMLPKKRSQDQSEQNQARQPSSQNCTLLDQHSEIKNKVSKKDTTSPHVSKMSCSSQPNLEQTTMQSTDKVRVNQHPKRTQLSLPSVSPAPDPKPPRPCRKNKHYANRENPTVPPLNHFVPFDEFVTMSPHVELDLRQLPTRLRPNLDSVLLQNGNGPTTACPVGSNGGGIWNEGMTFNAFNSASVDMLAGGSGGGVGHNSANGTSASASGYADMNISLVSTSSPQPIISSLHEEKQHKKKKKKRKVEINEL
mmetsp:Transcript_36869/g.48853  ORF Transcript_36869/g.48853 Transcript_36869/m.48853 type:complete len:258 (-) Transcript_36869:1-774(-)